MKKITVLFISLILTVSAVCSASADDFYSPEEYGEVLSGEDFFGGDVSGGSAEVVEEDVLLGDPGSGESGGFFDGSSGQDADPVDFFDGSSDPDADSGEFPAEDADPDAVFGDTGGWGEDPPGTASAEEASDGAAGSDEAEPAGGEALFADEPDMLADGPDEALTDEPFGEEDAGFEEDVLIFDETVGSGLVGEGPDGTSELGMVLTVMLHLDGGYEWRNTGGDWIKDRGPLTLTCAPGTVIGGSFSLPENEWIEDESVYRFSADANNKVFGGWQTEDGTRVSDGYVIQADVDFYARWVEVINVNFQPTGGEFEGDPSARVLTEDDLDRSVLEAAPLVYWPDGSHSFQGWTEDSQGGYYTDPDLELIDETVLVEDVRDKYLYAVWNSPVTGIELDRSSASLVKGESLQLSETISPPDASCQEVIWSSDNEAAATVDYFGYVTAVGSGTATITATTEDGGKTASCGITVTVPVTGVTLNTTSATVARGGTIQLTATVKPKDATDRNVTWSSNRTSVATVSGGGLVEAVGEGTATITATTEDGGKTASCEITVFSVASPVIKSITNTADGAVLKWGPVQDASGYEIYRDGSSIKKITSGSALSYTDTGAKPGTAYTYTMTAYRTVGGESYESEPSEGVAHCFLAAPSISNIVNISTGVKLTWGKVTGAAGYYLYRGSTRIKTLTGTTYTDTAAANNTKYTYKLYAYKTVAGKTFKSAVSAEKVIYYISRPSLTSVESVSSGVKITWPKIAGASGYYVYRESTRIRTISSGSTLTYTDTASKTDGTKYTYKIYAFKNVDGTIYKSTVSATKFTYFMSRPAISSAVNSAAGAMTVTWGKNAKANGYQVKYVLGTTEKTVTVSSGSTVSRKITGLTKGSSYKVYVRSFKTVSDKKYFSSWSAYKTVKITK